MPHKIYRVCIIGTGMIATSAHLPAFCSMPDKFTVCALCDPAADRAGSVAAQFNIPAWYTTAEAMLEKEKPDVVVITAPNMLHRPYVLQALEAGCHVLCEKPIAFSFAEANEMYTLAEKKHLLLEACQTKRFEPDRLAAKAMIDRGEVGEIYAARALYLRRRGIPTWGKFHIKEYSGGGAFVDLGVHMLDAAVWLMNDPIPKEVTASFAKRIPYQNGGLEQSGAYTGQADTSHFDPSQMNVEEFAYGMVRFENDAMLEFNIAWQVNAPSEVSLRLMGEKKGLDLPAGKVYAGASGEEELSLPPKRFGDHPFFGHFELIENFYYALRGDAPLFIKPQETIHVCAIMEMAMLSAEQKRAVRYNELTERK